MGRFLPLSETKNGHSVLLRFHYNKISFLLGGDLNRASQNRLLNYYSIDDLASKTDADISAAMDLPHPETDDEHDAIVSKTRPTLQVDIAKSPHHGSNDVSDTFLRATNTLVTVISSGGDVGSAFILVWKAEE